MPEILTWKGGSGEKYKFELYSISSEFPAIPGVYIFTKKLPNKRWGAIYVGQTRDLSDRLDDSHEAWPCVKCHGATHVCVLTDGMGRARNREATEDDLLAIRGTPCNERQSG